MSFYKLMEGQKNKISKKKNCQKNMKKVRIFYMHQLI